MKELNVQSFGCTDLTDQQLEAVKGGGFWRWVWKVLVAVANLIITLAEYSNPKSASTSGGYYDVYNYEYA